MSIDDEGAEFSQILDSETPSDKAELRIFLTDPQGQRVPDRWIYGASSPVPWRGAYGRDGGQRFRTAIRAVLRRGPYGFSSGRSQELDELPAGSATLTALTAFYLAAEQAMQPDEPAYDVDEGLQRFSAWLDDQTE